LEYPVDVNTACMFAPFVLWLRYLNILGFKHLAVAYDDHNVYYSSMSFDVEILSILYLTQNTVSVRTVSIPMWRQVYCWGFQGVKAEYLGLIRYLMLEKELVSEFVVYLDSLTRL
jgi:hypothetical protein